MAPVVYGKAALSLLRAFFYVPRLPLTLSSLPRRPIKQHLWPCRSLYDWGQPWQHHVMCKYSSGRDGGDGEDGFSSFEKARPGSSFKRQQGGDEDEEDVSLFGEKGVFGPIGKGVGDDEYDREEWEDKQTQDGEWTGHGGIQDSSSSAGFYEGDEDSSHGQSAEMDGNQGPEGGQVQQKAAFGDHVAKAGYTEDDISDMILGFCEPETLPHLDDYVFVDKDAQRKDKRRQIELEKMAEMAKRWVKKIDAHGFAHGVGRRKSSSARVWIKEGEGKIVINKKYHDMYFSSLDNRVEYLEPFVVTRTMGMFDAFVLVRGGGISGQAGAIRHGIARALMWYDPSYRPVLKSAGMLRRDDRVVERKKPGKAKARKSYQWVKR